MLAEHLDRDLYCIDFVTEPVVWNSFRSRKF